MKAEWAPLSQGTAAPKALSEEGAPLFRRGSVTQVRMPASGLTSSCSVSGTPRWGSFALRYA